MLGAAMSIASTQATLMNDMSVAYYKTLVMNLSQSQSEANFNNELKVVPPCQYTFQGDFYNLIDLENPDKVVEFEDDNTLKTVYYSFCQKLSEIATCPGDYYAVSDTHPSLGLDCSPLSTNENSSVMGSSYTLQNEDNEDVENFALLYTTTPEEEEPACSLTVVLMCDED